MADVFAVPPLPPPPSPTKIALWTGQIRAVIALLAGIGFGGAWLQKVTDTQISDGLTAFLTVAGLVLWGVAGAMSWYKEHWQAAAARSTAVASAVASVAEGTPVTVAVTQTPPGMPDIVVATHIPLAEQAVAPSPPVGQPPQPAPAA